MLRTLATAILIAAALASLSATAATAAPRPDGQWRAISDVVESPAGTTLMVKGYFINPAIGRTQTWIRAGR